MQQWNKNPAWSKIFSALKIWVYMVLPRLELGVRQDVGPCVQFGCRNWILFNGQSFSWVQDSAFCRQNWYFFPTKTSFKKKKKVIYNPLGQEQNVTFAHKSQAAAKGSMRFILPNFRCLHSTGADTQPAPRGHPPSCSHSRGMSEWNKAAVFSVMCYTHGTAVPA